MRELVRQHDNTKFVDNKRVFAMPEKGPTGRGYMDDDRETSHFVRETLHRINPILSAAYVGGRDAGGIHDEFERHHRNTNFQYGRRGYSKSRDSKSYQHQLYNHQPSGDQSGPRPKLIMVGRGLICRLYTKTMVDLRRVVFTKARVAALIRDAKANKKLPEWMKGHTIRGTTLYLAGREVIPAESVDTWLRSRVYDKKKTPVNMSRDGGWTDFVERETYGISRRAWWSWLGSQEIHQHGIARPKPSKNAGQKLFSRGTVQVDLVEAKSKDLPGRRATDTFFFTMVDLLTGYLVCLEVRTKEVAPPKARGTLVTRWKKNSVSR